MDKAGSIHRRDLLNVCNAVFRHKQSAWHRNTLVLAENDPAQLRHLGHIWEGSDQIPAPYRSPPGADPKSQLFYQ